MSVGQFTLGLSDGFAAVGTLCWHGPAEIEPAGRTFGMPEGVEVIRKLDPGAASLEVTVAVGVCFEPLTRLFSAIGGWPLLALCEEDVEDLQPPPSQAVVSVDSLAGIPAAAGQLAGMIAAYAVPFAEPYASLERALQLLCDRELFEPREAAVVEAALLTAAGRWEQAEDALARLEALGGEGDWDEDRRLRRIVRQLHRFIEARGELAIPESSARWPAPQWRFPRRETRSFSPDWAGARTKSRAEREALAAVRAAADGKSHDELKAMLAREQRGRGLDPQPLKLESQTARIEAERDPGATRATLRDGVRELFGVGRDLAGLVRRAVRDEEERPPAWMLPPENAAYPVRAIGQRRSVEVQLDPELTDWLARVAAHAAMKIGPTGMVEVWLEPLEPLAGGDMLAVHIGGHRVGVLTGEAAGAYQPAIEAAAERDELPWTEAQLTPIAGPRPYLLTLAPPATPERSAN
ncbi:MAG: hypothetical protein ACYCSI_08210 [Solirubrobacteraceae bacterium]